MIKDLVGKIRKNEIIKEIFRFLIVGFIATLVDYLVTGLYEYIVSRESFGSFLEVFSKKDIKTSVVLVATTLGFLSGLLVNYICSIMFVYKEKGYSQTKLGFLVFTILSLVGLLISNIGMYIGYDLLKINQWVVKVVMTFVVMIYNYVSKRLIIFKKAGKDDGKD